VPPGGVAAALTPLPVAALRLTPETAAALEALGLRRIGDLVSLPRAALAARFGDAVAEALDRALGRRPEPLSPLTPATPRFTRLAFAEPIGRTEDLAGALDSLLATLCATLEGAGLGARRLVLGVYEPDGNARHITVGTSRPSRAPAHLARLFVERLDDIEAAFGVDAMTLAAPVAEPLDAAQAGLEGKAVSADQTGALVDRLVNRFGAERVVRLVARASHVPERAQRTVSALDNAAHALDVWPAASRPLRLLSRPEPIEATAPVPDDPPALFRWRRVLHRVARADGPERIAPEWWLDGAPADEAAARDYYRVEDQAGLRFWVFRQGLYRPGVTPEWFLHGVFE
jgi:protein ImuB